MAKIFTTFRNLVLVGLLTHNVQANGLWPVAKCVGANFARVSMHRGAMMAPSRHSMITPMAPPSASIGMMRGLTSCPQIYDDVLSRHGLTHQDMRKLYINRLSMDLDKSIDISSQENFFNTLFSALENKKRILSYDLDPDDALCHYDLHEFEKLPIQIEKFPPSMR